MDTNTLAPLSTATTATANSASTIQSRNTLSADFETFLQLLTTQMKNQDPTNPQDSTEFIAQLASFSAVEQQVATNEKLQELVDAMSANGMNGLANWIGAEVRSAAATQFDGEPIEIAFTAPQDAQSAYVSVRDEENAEVARVAVSPNDVVANWDGKDFTGADATPGSYTFAIVGLADGVITSNQAALTYSRVTEARSQAGEIYLIFADGSKMAAKDADYARTTLADITAADA